MPKLIKERTVARYLHFDISRASRFEKITDLTIQIDKGYQKYLW